MKNWKTTIIGAASGATLVGLQLYQTGTTDLKTIITAIGIAFVGFLAKDAGGSTPAAV
jgi:hypothetical protein